MIFQNGSKKSQKNKRVCGNWNIEIVIILYIRIDELIGFFGVIMRYTGNEENNEMSSSLVKKRKKKETDATQFLPFKNGAGKRIL